MVEQGIEGMSLIVFLLVEGDECGRVDEGRPLLVIAERVNVTETQCGLLEVPIQAEGWANFKPE